MCSHHLRFFKFTWFTVSPYSGSSHSFLVDDESMDPVNGPDLYTPNSSSGRYPSPRNDLVPIWLARKSLLHPTTLSNLRVSQVHVII